jgi:bacterioferritin-associated ferredoxin
MVAVYICLCNALTDRQVRQAAATQGFTKPGDIYAACGCRAQCGQCTRTLINLLRGDATSLEQHTAN